MNTQAIGKAAEQLACRYLQTQGLRHVSQNFNRRMGEIDLIMFDDNAKSWVLVEVRYRKNSRYGNPAISVDRNKQSKLKVAARAFLQQHAQPQHAARIDVVALSPLDPSAAEEMERSLTLHGRVSTEFEDHALDWFINAIDG
ncbi:MAG: YraN family protein [Granulosicoccaceae bacterium]